MAAAENPDLIRQDVERTREELGATAEALAYKADAPARVKDRITGAKDSVTEKVGGVRDSLTGTVSSATPDAGQVKQRAGSVKSTAEGNPMGLLVGSVALGFVAGTLLPATRAERKAIAPAVEQVQDAASGAAQEVAGAVSSS